MADGTFYDTANTPFGSVRTGATTLSITTLSIMTLSIIIYKNLALSVMEDYCYAESFIPSVTYAEWALYAECY
jgi:hypothetical protein